MRLRQAASSICVLACAFWLVGPLAGTVVALAGSSNHNKPQVRPIREQVMLFLVAPTSFERLLSDPLVRRLATSGGAALMSPRTVAGDAGAGAYATLGTGTRSSAPFSQGSLTIGARYSGAVRDLPALVRENAGRSTPGLLGSLMEQHGLSVVLDLPLGGSTVPGAVVDSNGALVAMDEHGSVPLVGPVDPGPQGAPAAVFSTYDLTVAPDLSSLDLALQRSLSTAVAPEVMVIVLAAQPSPQMVAAKDELTPIVLAQGPPASLLPSPVSFTHTLTSDTTRRVGVVSNEDVMPTILSFLGVKIPSEVTGTPIRIVAGPAPYAMHARHLDTRRIWVPVQTVGAIFFVLGGLSGFLVVLRPVRSKRIRTLAAWAVLTPIPLTTSMLAAGHLPWISYATSGTFIVVMTVGVTTLALVLFGRQDVLLPPAVVGALALVYFVFEAATRWTGALYTLFGGTELDGARWYGLPNALEGVLLGAAVYLAAKLPRRWGAAVIFAAGLFAGWPTIGADLGGGLEILFAAGLWFWIRREDRWRPGAVVSGAAIPMVGVAGVLAANRYLSPVPTHVTRFIENAGKSSTGLLGEAVDRLSIGWDLLVHNPFGFIPVLLGPLCLLLLWRPPAQVRRGFARFPVWRDAMVVLVLASIAAYFVNDTGVAAMGMGIGSALGGILYVGIAAGSENIEA